MRLPPLLVVSIVAVSGAIAACRNTEAPVPPPPPATADITGSWHGNTNIVADSVTLTLQQTTAGAISGSGNIWGTTNGVARTLKGQRTGDTIIVRLMPPGQATDTIFLTGLVTKDAFGDEIFATYGPVLGSGNAVALHRLK